MIAVGKVPSAEAMRLNGEGKQLYRQERWMEARAKYMAAFAEDPDLLGAQINVACSLSRQGRYDEAAEEAAKLIRRAFVPWSREVAEAADLGILQDQASFSKIEAARSEASVAWGKHLREAVLFVGRTKPPLRVDGEGMLVLGLNQEIFAWRPDTGRYFQVTAEDGHVLALARSKDGNRVAYILAGKLGRVTGQPLFLRGLAIRVLDLPSMALGPTVPIPGDITNLELWFDDQPRLNATDATGARKAYRLAPAGLESASDVRRPKQSEMAILGPTGAAPFATRNRGGTCRFKLSTKRDMDSVSRIEVAPTHGTPFLLDTRFGAGLLGIKFPGEPWSPTTSLTAKPPGPFKK